jgi:acyl transferase domain-containing protein/acyl carrier protein
MAKIEENPLRTGLEIAVIGLAGRFPGADNVAQFWDNLKNGLESIAFFSDPELLEAGVEPELLENPHYVRAKAVLSGIEFFDAAFFDYTAREAVLMDPQFRLLHQCAWEALESAGYCPDAPKGIVGIYTGSAFSPLWIAHQLLPVLRSSNTSESFEVTTFFDRDYLNSRVSYKLNLLGPTFTVQTACSTSLAAIHLACRGLLSGECTMALAGGVSVTNLNRSGYLYQQGMINSPDGHCRAFDAGANGTVFGDGVGIVVLKHLENALDDGDFMYAVIEGSVVNNDGSRRVGYTAPSTRGQAAVIRAALELAEVEAGAIGYVEAHGTGTALGDPIEVEALKTAFNTRQGQFCRLGSVKANVGHLDYAAGVAGFIKTVLAVHHRLIPPTLHFQAANPAVDFENSPFRVNTEAYEWSEGPFPRRAGVSSFGIGGTNAHVILREAPGVGRGQAARPQPGYRLVLLSARTTAALEQVVENLRLYLKENPAVVLGDVAYTLQVGRKAFDHRCMAVCPTVPELLKMLSAGPSAGLQTHCLDGRQRNVAFMFPGLGAQYVNMGLGLYRDQEVFRRAMDRCFAILKPLMEYDLKDILYPPVDTPAAPALGQIDIAQAAVFVFEYALTELLMAWGIKPAALIGYSFGEYAAACIAGVFSLEDALQLIVRRGQLLRELPPGAMLAVPLPEKEVEPLLGTELSVAVDNGASCVVSGPTAAVEGLAAQLKEKKYLCMPVSADRALHSAVMEPVLPQFEERVKAITLNRPRLPYIAGVTGTWIGEDEAVDPAYWSRQLRRTVRFGPGLKTLLSEGAWLLVELGPGRDLGGLAVRYMDSGHEGGESNHRLLNLVRPGQSAVPDEHYLLDRLGRLWLYGAAIDWPAFYGAERRYRLPLPTYPFERHHFWFEDNRQKMDVQGLLPVSPPAPKPDMADWFYLPLWKQTVPPLLMEPTGDFPADSRSWVLVFVDDCGLGPAVVESLERKGCPVLTVEKGRCRDSRDYDAVIEELPKSGRPVQKIVHMWSLKADSGSRSNRESFDACLDPGFYSLLLLVQALDRHKLAQKATAPGDDAAPLEIVVVTRDLYTVSGQEEICPEGAAILGLVKTIPQEYGNIACRHVDLADLTADTARHLGAEITADNRDLTVAYRGGNRWRQGFEALHLEGGADSRLRLRERGVYLVTGGLGRDSLARAEYLARTVKARLVLTGRRGLPERPEWERWLRDHAEDEPTAVKIRRVQALEELGSEVVVIQADAAHEAEMAGVFRHIDERFGELNGVIHAAGVTGIESSVLISDLTPEQCRQHFRPKVYGLYVLQELLKGRQVDFCLLTSSIAAITGGIGLAAYTAASIFMDAFARSRRAAASTSWISLNWEGGTAAETAAAFGRIMSLEPVAQLVVSRRHLHARLEERFGRKERQQGPAVPTGLYARPHLMSPYVAPRNSLEQELAAAWQEIFGIDQPGVQDDFFELGGDSLKAISLIAKVHKRLGKEVPLPLFFRSPTIEGLAAYLKGAGEEAFLSIEPVEQKEYYPLASAQKRLFVSQQLERESIRYNEFQVVQLEGRLDRERLAQLFRRQIRRHESFRTSFRMVEGEPVQVIRDTKGVAFDLEYYDLTGGVDGQERRLKEIEEGFIRPFDLAQPPLLRAALIRRGDEVHLLIVDMHHITADGLSHEIFRRELSALYVDRQLPGLKLQYKDYAEWQNRQLSAAAQEEQAGYWLKAFSDGVPVMNLPVDGADAAPPGLAGDYVHVKIDRDLGQKIKGIVRQAGTTLNIFLLAAYYILLSRYTGQEDLVIGTPTAGRRHEELQDIVGCFINVLALRNRPGAHQTFGEFLEEVKVNAFNAYQNQDYPFEELIARLGIRADSGRNPLFEAAFDFRQLATDREEPSGLKISPYKSGRRRTHFALVLFALWVDGDISLEFEYATALFKRATVEKMAKNYLEIVEQVAARQEVKLGDLLLSHHLMAAHVNLLQNEQKGFNLN